MKMKKRLLSVVLSLIVATSFCNIASAADDIIIDSVVIKEYKDKLGAPDENFVTFVVDFTMINSSKETTLLLSTENISVISSQTESKILYIDQKFLPNKTTYTFAVEKEKIKTATGLSDIEGCTLYVKMGGEDISQATVKVITYHDPSLKIIYGDVTGDDIVDIGDAIKILKYDAGYETLTATQEILAEVTGDGIVDIADAIKILRYDAGLISSVK